MKQMTNTYRLLGAHIKPRTKYGGRRLENLCVWKDGNSVYALNKSCNGCNGYNDNCDSYMTNKIINEKKEVKI